MNNKILYTRNELFTKNLLINTLLKRKTKKVDVTKSVDDNVNCSTSAIEISEKFNEYFANMAENLRKYV